MCFFTSLLVLAYCTQVKGGNLLRGKFTDQSSTVNVDYMSSKAVDGSLTSGCSSTSPFGSDWWQADLLGFYTITSISVRPPSGYGPNLNIGASRIHVRCDGSAVFECGTWPNSLTSETTRSFPCSPPYPVRFIRIWKPTTEHLRLIEVEAEGVPAKPTALAYELQYTDRKYTYPRRTLTVSIVNECASSCFFTPSCVGFSFLEGASDNCLIVLSCRYWEPGAGWKMYNVDDSPTFCG